MAVIFGFEVNLLELMVFLEILLLIAVAALVWELRKVQKFIAEARLIEKMHSEEKKRGS